MYAKQNMIAFDGRKGYTSRNVSLSDHAYTSRRAISERHRLAPYSLRWLAFNILHVHAKPLDHLFAHLVASRHVYRAQALWCYRLSALFDSRTGSRARTSHRRGRRKCQRRRAERLRILVPRIRIGWQPRFHKRAERIPIDRCTPVQKQTFESRTHPGLGRRETL